jgi:hypothetical protein
MKSTSAIIAVSLGLLPEAILADAPEVTPYRPTVSNPAALPAPGLVELEGGIARTQEDLGGRLFSVPYLLKYAFNENFGLLLGGDAYLNQVDAQGNRLTGIGDTVAQIKLRHALSDSVALGLESGVRFATAKTALGAEKNDFILNGIASVAAANLNVDINVGYTHVGFQEDGQGSGVINWATALSGKLGGPWGWATELSGAGQHGTRGSSQVLGAATYQPARTLVLDAGLAHDLNRYTNQTTVFTGFSFLFDH